MKFRSALLLFACFFFGNAGAQVQGFPSKPVNVVIPGDPGGILDLLARTAGQGLSETWKQPLLLQHAPGGSYQIGASRVLKSAPDGYTLFLAPETAFVTNQFLFSKLSYNPTQFIPITGLVAIDTILIVNPSLPARSVAELLDWAKKNPGALRFGTTGNGSVVHLFLANLEGMAGVQFTMVHYKGMAPVLTAVMGGHIEAMMVNASLARGAVDQGKVRMLGTTGSARNKRFPDLPTIAETVPRYSGEAWFGLWAPGGTPMEIVQKISADMRRALAAPAFQQLVETNGWRTIAGSPKEFQDFIDAEAARWKLVIQKANIKVD